MSDPHSASASDADRNAEAEPADRAERTAEAEAEAAARAGDDAEDVESEWHVWILALIVVAGVALFFAPRFLLPELLGSLGVLLVAVGALGLVVKWAIERAA